MNFPTPDKGAPAVRPCKGRLAYGYSNLAYRPTPAHSIQSNINTNTCSHLPWYCHYVLYGTLLQHSGNNNICTPHRKADHEGDDFQSARGSHNFLQQNSNIFVFYAPSHAFDYRRFVEEECFKIKSDFYDQRKKNT